MAENNNKQENIILCGANSYQQKYYFNEKFKLLPEKHRANLDHVRPLRSLEDVAHPLPRIHPGNLEFRVEAEDQDYLFDEIGSGLKIRQYQREKKELLESLELFYRVVFLGGKLEDHLERGRITPVSEETSEKSRLENGYETKYICARDMFIREKRGKR